MEFKDYYKTLEVTSKATPEEIKKAYKRLARKYHPDVSKEKNAEQQFKEVAEAYEVLKDPEKRQEYDQLKAAGGSHRRQYQPPPGWDAASRSHGEADMGDFSDFFASMFGHRGGHAAGGQHIRMRGEDVQAELALLLEEVYQGCEQLIQIRVPEFDELGRVSYREKKLKVKIPAGSTAGSVLRIKGQGGGGIGGGAAGDLLVTLKVAAHPLFSVEGKNLSLVVPVLPWEAALGCSVTVPTVLKKTRVTIPAGSQSGQKLRLKGQGMPGHPPGDFYVVLKVVMPDTISAKAKELYRDLQQIETQNPRADWEDKS